MKKLLCCFCSLVLVLSVQGIVVSASEVDIKEDLHVKDLAYMSLENAPETIQADIIEARNAIIFEHTGWVADDWSGAVIDVRSGQVIRELPKFHDVFPDDWDIPYDLGFTDSHQMLASTDRASYASDYSTIFNGQVYLNKAGTVNASPFYYFTLDPSHLSAYTYASSLTSSATCNIGYSNRSTGASMGYATKLSMYEALWVYNPTMQSTTSVNVRASTDSTPGWSNMIVNRSNNGSVVVK